MTTGKIYPTNGDYNLSVQNLSRFGQEPRLVAAQPQTMANGGLIAYSGGYSRVYPVKSGRGTFALRCWTADVGDARERYRRIGEYLNKQGLPFFVEFEYLENAILVKGQRYPVLWMEWAEGPRLRDYVAQHLGDAPGLRAVADSFGEMVAALHDREISHGDLQDENIVVQNGGAGPRMRLIDYDSLFVPTLRGYPDQIIGISHYQHPRRAALGTASEKVDHFSELVIYLSILAYAQNPRLWNPHYEKRLLFADSDFVDPDQSPAFGMLRYMTGEVRMLTDCLVGYCREGQVERLPPLEQVIGRIGSAGSRGAPASPGGGLPDDFLNTPPTPAGPAGQTILLPDDFLATSRRPAAPAGPKILLPDDFLGTPPAPSGPAPAPHGGLILPPGYSHPTSASAPAPSAQASDPWAGFLQPRDKWGTFYQAATRTATSAPAPPQPQPGLRTQPPPRSRPAVPPVPSLAPPTAVGPATPRQPTAPTPGGNQGSGIGLKLFLLLILILVVLFMVGCFAPVTGQTPLHPQEESGRTTRGSRMR